MPEKRDLEARIEQLERLMQELLKTVNHPAADSNKQGQIKRDVLTDPRPKDAKWPLSDSDRNPGHRLLVPMHTPETEEDRQLKGIVVAFGQETLGGRRQGGLDGV